jgi:hypothetical protein
VQKNLIRNFIASQMNGSLRSNSLWLRVLLHAAQACVYEPVPVCTNYDRAWGAALRAAQETGIDLTLSIGLEVSILGSKDGIDVTITVRPPGRRHDPSSERF